MLDVNNTKNKIRNTVAGYKTMFPEEYKATLELVKIDRYKQKNEFSTIGKGDGFVVRALSTYPEKLFAAFVLNMGIEEMGWFKSKEGGRWFAKVFKEFSLAGKL